LRALRAGERRNVDVGLEMRWPIQRFSTGRERMRATRPGAARH
jgi:hypothetical protein